MPRVKRKPGGQPGNQNARKHGAYSKVLTPEEQRILTLASIPGIDGEIAVLRMRIASIIKEDRWPPGSLNRTMAAICRAVHLKHTLASRQRRELLALARLGIPIDGFITNRVDGHAPPFPEASALEEALSKGLVPPALSMTERSKVEGKTARI
jgi:hypothetical protein